MFKHSSLLLKKSLTWQRYFLSKPYALYFELLFGARWLFLTSSSAAAPQNLIYFQVTFWGNSLTESRSPNVQLSSLAPLHFSFQIQPKLSILSMFQYFKNSALHSPSSKGVTILSSRLKLFFF